MRTTHLLTIAAVLLCGGVRADDAADGEKASAPPLEFRIVVEVAEDAEEPHITPEAFENLQKKRLKRRRKPRRGPQWAPLAKSVGELPASVEHEGQRYALVSGDEHALPWDGEWKLLKAQATNLNGVATSIELELDAAAGERMRELTKAHLNDRLAVMISGQVVSTPTIRSVIAGQAVLTGSFDEVEQIIKTLAPVVAEVASEGALRIAAARVELPPAVGDWFYPDPYPQLGHENKGRDWDYMRIVVDSQGAKDLGLRPRQLTTIREIRNESLSTHDRLAKEEPKNAREQQDKLWSATAAKTRRLLSDSQHHRVLELIIQRHGFRAFLEDPVAERMDLDSKQRKEIETAIQDHFQRLGKMSRVNSAQHRGIDGRKSYVEAWIDIYDVLSDGQQQEFNRLRGPMPASALPKLQMYRFK